MGMLLSLLNFSFGRKAELISQGERVNRQISEIENKDASEQDEAKLELLRQVVFDIEYEISRECDFEENLLK